MFSCDFWVKSWNDPAVFWVMATAVITLVLAFVAWKQLSNLSRTSTADFIFRLKNDFFTQDARRLLFLVDEDLLKFEDGDIPYFAIRSADQSGVRDRLKELGITGSTISTYVVDDVLLGPFEDIHLFLSQGLITAKQAYEMFFTYVESCAENDEVQKYIAAIRRNPDDTDIYSGFDDLFKRLRAVATLK